MLEIFYIPELAVQRPLVIYLEWTSYRGCLQQPKILIYIWQFFMFWNQLLRSHWWSIWSEPRTEDVCGLLKLNLYLTIFYVLESTVQRPLMIPLEWTCLFCAQSEINYFHFISTYYRGCLRPPKGLIYILVFYIF
jgi:hypothetical protein